MQKSLPGQGYIGLMSELASMVEAPNEEYLVSLNNSECSIGFWTPRAEDDQKPHDRDEIYVLVAGHAHFEMDGKHRAVKAGDLIFVPAGKRHRFLDFTGDLAMWFAFFGRRHAGHDPTP